MSTPPARYVHRSPSSRRTWDCERQNASARTPRTTMFASWSKGEIAQVSSGAAGVACACPADRGARRPATKPAPAAAPAASATVTAAARPTRTLRCRREGIARHPEVRQAHVAPWVEQQVRGFDVAMDDPLRVREVERVRGLREPAEGEPLRRIPAIGDAAGQELEHEVRTPLPLAGVVE